ncbi:alpha/beta hydrolase [Amycolatopsis sp. NBC_01480]|uniref:alpha/beta hydrolase n=1 Tax=Amycolatopsis sp. NBC_01480 TaxID=2903562 RepID=UPI002E27D1C3|nr:alpha/beta hydrolase [Amycolatopsis sp. NBC_01480]
MSRDQRAEIDAVLRAPRPVPSSLAEMRAGFAATQSRRLVPAAIRISDTALGARRALLVEPAGPPDEGTLLYFHGGSFMLGSPETSLSVTANLVTRSGSRGFSLDYRLAPEHPFPAAVDDGIGAYQALLAAGTDPAKIVLAGDSAGGGLAVTTVLKALDRGLPLPAAIVVFSPALDLTFSGASMSSKEDADPIFTPAMLRPAVEMYCAGQDLHQPLLSPARYADLTRFPPMLLQVGTNELLLDDSVRMAERARGAGVDVVLDVTADVPHVFQAFAGVLGEADQALDRAALFVRQHVGARGGPGG